MGHGHVVPNADGSRARCGGPGICSECSAEAARLGVAYPFAGGKVTVTASSCRDNGKGFCTSCSTVHTMPQPSSDTVGWPKFIEADGDIWAEHVDGSRTQITKSAITRKYEAWECPRCHRINAPHAQQCSCTGQET